MQVARCRTLRKLLLLKGALIFCFQCFNSYMSGKNKHASKRIHNGRLSSSSPFPSEGNRAMVDYKIRFYLLGEFEAFI